ncbi:MAG TPA: MFS transporter, partial [Novosphingobium sp.]|nr:MFS transporter [Novosphingobium sp.]
AFMSFGLAFFARPVGAIVFGHFGDRIGRKSTLVASLMLMGVSTLLIAFLPTYAMLGWVAPLLLCVLRFGQGFGLGGEWGGASLLAVEYAPRGWEARFGSAPQFGAPVGFLFANGLFLVLGLTLSDAQFTAWGWRIPFLASAFLVGLGLWVRLRIAETPAFREALAREKPPAVPLAQLLGHHFGAVMAGTAGAVACFAIFYLSTAYALAQGTGSLGYPRETFLGVQLGANCFFALGILFAVIRADRVGSGTVLLQGAVATVAMGLVFGAGLQSGSLLVVFATLSASLFIMGLVYGPLGSWLPSLLPVTVRYSGISLAFNLGGIIGGALAPIAAQQLAAQGHANGAGWFMSAAGAMTLAGVVWARKYQARAAG